MGWSPLDINKPRAKQYIGDEPYNAISECFAEVCRMYQRDWKRKPSVAELLGTVQAVLSAQLQDHTSDGETAELTAIGFKTHKITKRQKYAAGDVLQAKMKNGESVFARVFAIEDRCPMVGVYDSRGMSPVSIAEIVRQKLIVKVCPMHPETLELREWLVIANAKVTAADKKQPRGPKAISGDNRHLEMGSITTGCANRNTTIATTGSYDKRRERHGCF